MSAKNQILSQKYILNLYPKQKYYGENIKPIKEEYEKFEDINITNNEIEKYWLYEIIFEQIEEIQKKKNEKQILKTRSIFKRVSLGDMLITCDKM